MYSNRCNTLNTSSRKSAFRPNSASKRHLNLYKIYTSNGTPPPILLTMPTNSKKRSGMGNKIEREQLYENNMQLKDVINNLRRELAELKNKVVKKDIELRKKDKIIKECSKENDLESAREINLEKARESTLVSLCKEQYNDLKNKYNEKCIELNELNSTYKITKLKEYTIQIDTYKKEMEKIRNLYLQTIENNNKLNKEINTLKELKKRFLEQHEIINNLKIRCQKSEEENKNLREENDEYKIKFEQILKKQQLLKKKNFKLKLSNKKFLDIKKNRENYELYIDDNKKLIVTLKKELEEYKRLYEGLRKEYNKVVEQQAKKDNNKLKSKAGENIILNPFKNIGVIEVKKESKDSNKLSLYKSLIEEYKYKIDIYELYLKRTGIDKDELIKAFGFDGVVTASTRIPASEELNNNLESVNNNNGNNNNNLATIETNLNTNNNINNINTENSEEINKEQSIKNINNIIQIDNNTNNNNKTSNSNNFNKLSSIEEEKQDDGQLADENQLLSLLHVFVKNLEANGITKEQINQKIDDISKLFENKNEATKEEFIEPFVKMFIETMKITKKEDIEVVGNFLNDFVDSLNGEISIFFNGLVEVFDNVNDYTGINKDNELSFKLSKYKEDLISLLKKEDINNTHLITFEIFRKIVHDLNLLLDDESMEYLIYLMKKNVPKNNSIFDLNYEIIEKLLEKNEIKEELIKLKNALSEENTNLDGECLEFINTFDYQGKKFMIVKKEDFLGLLQKLNLNFTEEITEGIFECFKFEIEGEGNEKIEWIDYERLKAEIESSV